ncbi:outer membrane beta-barrel protein [Labilibacter marinus]|uniref:outer membrane beta-barrel protein n=1 Tax=Labilibacter marinus TaxID=1477105 RepID=UPI00094F61DC|nr:outer membrane beta-barrel protein [Labilibacter marinus]
MNKVLVLLGVMVFFCAEISAYGEKPSGTIQGKVVAFQNSAPLEYVTVAIYHTSNNELQGGVITKPNGIFQLKQLPNDTYYLDISFVGYKTKRINNIIINEANRHVDLGQIELGEEAKSIDEVEVVAERSFVEFKLDKKIINVSKQFTSLSGTAVNVLENVPSVTVDIEGNVELRGSGGFSVLIDGVPSVLEPSEALQQIPASTIENIEIITNPSAKYNPDGTAGIINIITKKNRMNGFNGVINLKAGSNNFGSDFLFNFQRKKVLWFVSADYNLSDYSGEKYGTRETYNEATTFTVSNDGSIRTKYTRYNVKGGMEMRFDSLNTFNVELGYGNRGRNSYSDLKYEEYDNIGGPYNSYLSDEDGYRGGDGLSINTFFIHRFADKGHELNASITYRGREADEYSRNVLKDDSGVALNGRESTEKGPMGRWQTKLDYTKPLTENSTLELGYQSTFARSTDFTGLLEDEDGSGDYEENPLYKNEVEFSQDIHALYATYGNQVAKFGYQVGLRGEYNNRIVRLVETGSEEPTWDDETIVEKLDLFPSIHMSYKLPSNQELMGSYSRRIERSRSYYLEPFYTWQDAYNIRRGNSALQPEYIDSYELNYLKKFGSSYFSFETYYRVTNNKVEWVRQVYEGNYEDNIIERYPENVGKDYSLGIDASIDFNIVKWWKMGVTGTLYNYKVKGEWGGLNYDEEQLTWNYKWNQTIKMGPLAQFQSNWRYYSKRITSQGVYEPVYTLDIAFKREMMKRKLSAVVELRDVFATNNRENTNKGIDFKDHYFQKIHTPILTFTFTYRFNNYKPERRRGGGEGFSDGESMD